MEFLWKEIFCTFNVKIQFYYVAIVIAVFCLLNVNLVRFVLL